MSGHNYGRMIFFLWIGLLIMGSGPHPVLSENIPTVNSYLPELKIEAPTSEKDRAYLGLGAGGFFSMHDVDAEIIMIEIVGVYCPNCHVQMPLFNDLFQRIKRDPDLYGKIKLLAIAVGATANEIKYFTDEYRIAYPVTKDSKFDIHKALGEPRTPFTMLVTRDRKVLFTHLGIIRDMDNFFSKVKGLLK
ncbi:MAG: hypothetical protein QG552_793 [Thermodesulfobacteriota bacterium]|nr:hypothetical protein [Thermodesulfobacteriota bacterium]